MNFLSILIVRHLQKPTSEILSFITEFIIPTNVFSRSIVAQMCLLF